MKKITPFIAVAALFATMVFANDNTARIEQALENYTNSLKFENAGVRHSSIFQVVKLSATNPEYNLNATRSVIKKMAEKDEYALIRFHAKLAYTYLTDMELAAKVSVEDYENPMDFFIELHKVAQTKYESSLAIK